MAAGGGPAPPSEATPLRARLDGLQKHDRAALGEEWRRLYRSEPPAISRDLLLRAIAYRLQELDYGALPKWARLCLAGSVITPDAGVKPPIPVETHLKPGACLVREWRGRTNGVTVLKNGFEFEGQRYASLTQVARKNHGRSLVRAKVFRTDEPEGEQSPGKRGFGGRGQGAHNDPGGKR